MERWRWSEHRPGVTIWDGSWFGDPNHVNDTKPEHLGAYMGQTNAKIISLQQELVTLEAKVNLLEMKKDAREKEV